MAYYFYELVEKLVDDVVYMSSYCCTKLEDIITIVEIKLAKTTARHDLIYLYIYLFIRDVK